MKKYKICAIAVLTLVIALECGYIYNTQIKNSGMGVGIHAPGVTNTASLSDKIVKINNETLPVYCIGNSDILYFADTDLACFGFNIEVKDNMYVLNMDSDTYFKASDAFVSGIDGEVTVLSNKKIKIGDNEYDCYEIKNSVLIAADAMAVMGEKRECAANNTVYYAFGAPAVIAESVKKSESEIAAAEGRYVQATSEPSPSAEAVPTPTNSPAPTEETYGQSAYDDGSESDYAYENNDEDY